MKRAISNTVTTKSFLVWGDFEGYYNAVIQRPTHTIANASFAASFGIEGLKSFWVLQHQRGFKPFETKANFKMTINGKF